MILADFHTHCCFSTDSSASLEEMIQGALQKGLRYLCFTDHMDLDFPTSSKEPAPFQFSPEEYFFRLSPLIRQYSNQLTVSIGIELGLRPDRPELCKQYHALLSDYPFDFSLGSLHLISNQDPYEPEFWETHDAAAALTDYFEQLSVAVRQFDGFDSLAHLDYLVRYLPSGQPVRDYRYEMFRATIDEILKLLIFRGQALEINTRGLSSAAGYVHPKEAVLKRYLELGGSLFTIGSDAHTPSAIASEYKKTRELLLSHGITRYCIYRKHQPEYLPL